MRKTNKYMKKASNIKFQTTTAEDHIITVAAAVNKSMENAL